MLVLKPNDIFADNYRLKEYKSSGGFAEVWKAERLFSKKTMVVALKIFPKMSAREIETVEDEYKSQVNLSHTNLLIARQFGVFNDQPYLEMRYCKGGDAFEKIGHYTEKEMAKCINQIASALDYLHNSKNRLHLDIKPNNFLINAIDDDYDDPVNDNNIDFYLADLGLSVKLRKTIARLTETQHDDGNERLTSTGATPPPYRAPELWQRNVDPVKATDIWALGASVYEMITGDPPFGEWGVGRQKDIPKLSAMPAGFSTELYSIIKLCLAVETWDRPKASQLVEWTNSYLKTGSYGLPRSPKKAVSKKVIAAFAAALLFVACFFTWRHFQTPGQDYSIQNDQVTQSPNYDPPANNQQVKKDSTTQSAVESPKPEHVIKGKLKAAVIIETDHFNLFVFNIDKLDNWEVKDKGVENSELFSENSVETYVSNISVKYHLAKNKIQFLVRDELAWRNTNVERVARSAVKETGMPVINLYDADQSKSLNFPLSLVNQYLK